MKNKYRVIPSNLKNASVRFRSTDRELLAYELDLLVLDADGPNDFARSLGIKYDLGDIDLNEAWSRKRDIYNITSFEVLEHLQNPLIYLGCIYNALNSGGRLFLTTPVKWMFKGKYHFHEYTRSELTHILAQAGFTNVSIIRIQAYNLKHFGIRPLIKKIRDRLLGQCFFVVAVKTNKE